MGFLDDLKKQAAELQAGQTDDRGSAVRSVQLVEAAAQGVRRYLMELASHLDVIRPPAQASYRIDRQVVVEGVPLVDFRFDARRRTHGGQELIDHVLMTATARTGRRCQLAKNFVNETEQLERRLDQASITCEREAVRHPDNGKLVEVRYTFVADVLLSVLVQARHDEGLLHFTLRNLDGLESVECSFPPYAVDQSRLDELARWWVGQPQRFLDGALEVRRVEAR